MEVWATGISAPEKCTRQLVLIAVKNAKYPSSLPRTGRSIAGTAYRSTGSQGNSKHFIYQIITAIKELIRRRLFVHTFLISVYAKLSARSFVKRTKTSARIRRRTRITFYSQSLGSTSEGTQINLLEKMGLDITKNGNGFFMKWIATIKLSYRVFIL